MAKNSNNSTAIIISLLIGMGIMFAIYTFVVPPKETEKAIGKEYSKVHKVNDLFVFIEAEPHTDYKTLKTIEGDDLITVWTSLGIGKDKFGKVLENILNSAQDNLVFSQKLEKMAEKAKAEFSDADGIIFSNKMNKCEVIKFN